MATKISPGLKTLFLVHLIVGAFFGLIYVLIPDMFGNLMGTPFKDPFMTRTVGAAVLAFAASSWLAYRESEWPKVRIVVVAEIVWTALATVVLLWGLAVGALPVADWLNVIIMGGFAVAFCYFYYKHTRGGAPA